MSNSTTPLHGMGALVTGGSRGIGATIACELASQRATIALTYSPNEAKANLVVAGIVKAGGTALASKADQANEERVIELVLTPFERLGQLDIQVNNAGVFEAGTVDETVDTSPFKRQLCINYQGVVAAIRVASRATKEDGRNITHWSSVALRSSWTDSADYSATKLTIEGCTKGAARELGPKGILVNATGAGSIDTDKNPSDGPLAENHKAGTALGRYCQPEEIAAVVTFIANPAVSYATGAINAVDGGFGAWGQGLPRVSPRPQKASACACKNFRGAQSLCNCLTPIRHQICHFENSLILGVGVAHEFHHCLVRRQGHAGADGCCRVISRSIRELQQHLSRH